MAFCFASPDAIRAALSHLDKEWDTSGYYIEGIDSPGIADNRGGARIHVVHGDGSRFTIEADRSRGYHPGDQGRQVRVSTA